MGIDLFKEIKRMNMKLRVNQLLSLLHAKGSNHHAINELIDEKVKKVIKPITISTIAHWVNDYKMDFKRLLIKRKISKSFAKMYGKTLWESIKFMLFPRPFY